MSATHPLRHVRSIGDLGALATSSRFLAAKLEAEAFADLLASGAEGRSTIETMSQACQAYAQGKADAEGRFMRLVYDDEMAWSARKDASICQP
jgi:hypothetical protein